MVVQFLIWIMKKMKGFVEERVSLRLQTFLFKINEQFSGCFTKWRFEDNPELNELLASYCEKFDPSAMFDICQLPEGVLCAMFEEYDLQMEKKALQFWKEKTGQLTRRLYVRGGQQYENDRKRLTVLEDKPIFSPENSKLLWAF